MALLAAVPVSQALAQDPVFEDSEGGAGYWTAGRLMRAKPLATPAAAMLSVATVEALGEQLPPVEDQVSGYGAQPIAEDEVAPDLEARVHPALRGRAPELAELSIPDLQSGQRDVARPADVGTAGAFFSSSRLVPLNARLAYPYKTAGKLFFVVPGEGDFVCSAAVLRPRIVLTAGHCVHSGSNGNDGFFTHFFFVPAFQRGEAPFRAWSAAFVVTTGSWANSQGNVPNRADFGILVIRDLPFGGHLRRIGDVTGFLGYRTNALLPNHTKKIGYPENFDDGQIEHQVDSQSFRFYAASTVLYGSDMRGGSSGGPWIENFGVPAVGQTGGFALFPDSVVGVTSFILDSPNPKVAGSSVLNDEFLEILDIACNQHAGNCEP
jgi:V8-like Glu-specific endopeptidase